MEKYSPYNELKIFRHLNRIGGLLQGERVAPIYVRIKPTNVCNQRCYYCAYSDDNLYDGRKVEESEKLAAVFISVDSAGVHRRILLHTHAGGTDRFPGLFGKRRHLGKQVGGTEKYSEVFGLPHI